MQRCPEHGSEFVAMLAASFLDKSVHPCLGAVLPSGLSHVSLLIFGLK
ncbi:Uncharacterised protein [Mycobacteroides abscessus subsp. abscessus]|nr:Uncharacterised protein [Mycobacteroides abscessus subsp. abscessus]